VTNAAALLLEQLANGSATNDPTAAAIVASGVPPPIVADAIVSAEEASPKEPRNDPTIALLTGLGGIAGALGGSFGLRGIQVALSIDWPLFVGPLLPLPWLVGALWKLIRHPRRSQAASPHLVLALLGVGLDERLVLEVHARLRGSANELAGEGSVGARAARALVASRPGRARPHWEVAAATAVIIIAFWMGYAWSFGLAANVVLP
jgi:hypothetical protein